ncbi:MAG: helix-turn-helix domain-containing protein [Halioglobus sp.]
MSKEPVDTHPYKCAAMLYPDALATSITLPMEILGAASQMARAGASDKPGVRFLLAGPERQPMTLASGVTLHTDIAYRDLPPLDLLLLPAIWRSPLPTVNAARPLLDDLSQRAATGTRICSVGTASCLLAEAGLLTGKPATTHWNHFERFADRYPDVQLKTRHLITQSDNIYCVGSVNSIADVMVHLVEEWFGSRIARAVENQFSPEIRRSFKAAAFQTRPHTSHQDETVLEAQQWLQDNLAGPISIARLAEILGVSDRTLNRRFRQATGVSPQGYLQNLRVTQARELLRHSNLAVNEVAWRVGLQDVSHFSRLFRQHVGMTPLRYREAVRGKLFAPRDQLAQLE